MNKDFSTGSIKKHIFSLAIPMIAAMMINALYSIVDRIYIGHIAGDGQLALTGIGLCFPITMLVSAFAGRERVLNAYAEAVKERYRFFSFGDAMCIL